LARCGAGLEIDEAGRPVVGPLGDDRRRDRLADAHAVGRPLAARQERQLGRQQLIEGRLLRWVEVGEHVVGGCSDRRGERGVGRAPGLARRISVTRRSLVLKGPAVPGSEPGESMSSGTLTSLAMPAQSWARSSSVWVPPAGTGRLKLNESVPAVSVSGTKSP